MSIGSNVRKYREAKSLSQLDLALQLDVAQTTISSIESDKSIPSSILLYKIADVLEVNINDLLEDVKTINNVYENNDKVIGVGNNYIFTLNDFSEKLTEQYEARMQQYEERIADLKEQLDFWKNKRSN